MTTPATVRIDAVVELGQVGDRALDEAPQRALDAHERMVAHVEAEHLLLGAQPLGLVELDVGDRRAGRRTPGESSASPPPRSKRLIVPCVALAPAAQRRVDDRLEHVEQTLARMAERVEAAALISDSIVRLLSTLGSTRSQKSWKSTNGPSALALLDEQRRHALADVAHRREPEADRVVPSSASCTKSLTDAFTSGTSTGISSWRHSLR